MTSKLVVNTIEADTGISSVSFASSISLSSTSKFFFGAAGIDIGADTNINRPAAGVLGFNINGTEKVRITSDAKVGIGEDPTISQFQVKTAQLGGTAGNTQEVVRLHSPDVSNTTSYRFTNYRTSNGTSHVTSELRFRRHVDSTDMGYFGLGDQYVSIGYGTAEKLRIDESGRLLIGSTSSAHTNNFLEVHTTYGGRMGFARNDTSTAAGNNLGTLSFYGNDSNGTFQESAKIEANADLDHATGDKPGRLVFYTTPNGATTPAEILRIDSNGHVGLKLTDPHLYYSKDLVVKAISEGGITIRANGGSDWNYLMFASGNSGAARYSGYIGFDHGNDKLRLSTNEEVAAKNIELRSDGNVHISDGNLVVASGHGIDFSATGNSSGSMTNELLADYEEGTFTPTNSIGMTLTNNNPAFYIKIGRMVHIQLDISFATAPNDTAQCGMIQSLPFTSDGTSGHDNTLGQQYISKSSTTGDSDYAKKFDYDDEGTRLVIEDGESRIDIYNNVGNYRRSRGWLCGRRIRISAWYKTAS